MDAMEAILTRRSVRKYTYKPISNEIIKDLIKAGICAPSAGDQQPWHFIIIDDKRLLNKIPDFHPHSKMLNDAQIAIVVCGDMNLESHKGFWTQDCSAATENILIAARAKGLGSCWLGVYPREGRICGLRKMLKIPENVIPFSLISLGYSAVDQFRVDRQNIERIHRNKW
jgi:nitroreductase